MSARHQIWDAIDVLVDDGMQVEHRTPAQTFADRQECAAARGEIDAFVTRLAAAEAERDALAARLAAADAKVAQYETLGRLSDEMVPALNASASEELERLAARCALLEASLAHECVCAECAQDGCDSCHECDARELLGWGSGAARGGSEPA